MIFNQQTNLEESIIRNLVYGNSYERYYLFKGCNKKVYCVCVLKLNEESREYIESKYAGSVYQDAVSSNLMNFLKEEEQVLPMYCNPCKLRRQLQGN